MHLLHAGLVQKYFGVRMGGEGVGVIIGLPLGSIPMITLRAQPCYCGHHHPLLLLSGFILRSLPCLHKLHGFLLTIPKFAISQSEAWSNVLISYDIKSLT